MKELLIIFIIYLIVSLILTIVTAIKISYLCIEMGLNRNRAIICGGKDFNPALFKDKYPDFENKIEEIFKQYNIDEEVCGLANGSDKYGRKFALDRGISVKEFPADWTCKFWNTKNDPVDMRPSPIRPEGYNYLAGDNRNIRMGDYTRKTLGNAICIALPGGPGTDHMINYSLSLGIKVYKFNEETGNFDLLN